MKLFGTDGIRGVANAELTPETAYLLGRVLAWRLGGSGSGERGAILLGKDPRLSSDLLEAAMAAGIMSSGADVYAAGVVPTPAVAYLTSSLAALAGSMISASHNPVEDNGIKCFSAEGYKLPDALEGEIEEIMAGKDTLPRPTGSGVGRVRPYGPQARRAYVDHLLGTVPEGEMAPLKVVVDCAHGSACGLAPEVLGKLGVQVKVIHGEPDGSRINVACGSTSLEDTRRAVLESGADLGLAFDGDADRCLAVDEKGKTVDGDALLGIIAKYRHERGALKGGTLVATVMTNLGLKLHLGKLGIRTVVTGVGDRYVLEAMRKGDYNLGGEQSGHIILRDYSTTGDGLLTALQLCRIVGERECPLSQLAGGWERMPQILLNVTVRDRGALGGNQTIADALREAQGELGEEGRVLLRPSGTEPLIRVMVEGTEQEKIQRIASRLAEMVASELS